MESRSNTIDYSARLMGFQAITLNYNSDIAMKYLTRNFWNDKVN